MHKEILPETLECTEESDGIHLLWHNKGKGSSTITFAFELLLALIWLPITLFMLLMALWSGEYRLVYAFCGVFGAVGSFAVVYNGLQHFWDEQAVIKDEGIELTYTGFLAPKAKFFPFSEIDSIDCQKKSGDFGYYLALHRKTGSILTKDRFIGHCLTLENQEKLCQVLNEELEEHRPPLK